MKIFKEISTYLIIIILVVLLKKFIVTPVRVNGDSMNDTYYNGDIMLLNKLVYHFSTIDRFDTIVIDTEDDNLIKRVIGLPGETISYVDGTLYVNNKKVEENFSHTHTKDFDLSFLNYEKIPKDMYLVLGDNRNNSVDSRTIGLISRNKIMGRCMFTIFPFNRFGNK